MGFWWDLLTGQADPVASMALESDPAQTFAVDWDSVDPAVFGLTVSPTGVVQALAPVPRVDRKAAMSVPAVMRSRNLIAGTLGSLPIDLYGPDGKRAASSLLEQPERNRPRSVTMARTIEDLLFEGVAWWRITEFGWHNFPTKVKRLDPREVTVNNEGVYVEGKRVPDAEIIRFDSPTDPLLVAGARAIRTCLHLDNAARNLAEEPLPLTYFTPQEGADPAEDDDIITILDGWKAARQARATGYVPAALKLNTVTGLSPEQLQLAEARQHAVLEIARLAGVDPEELGVSTTSRTYQNDQDRRKNFVDFTLGIYRQAVEERLGMSDVTPRGYTARFNLSEFLRSDDKARMEVAAAGLSGEVLTKEEARRFFDPALDVAPAATQPVARYQESQTQAEFSMDQPLTLDFGSPRHA